MTGVLFQIRTKAAGELAARTDDAIKKAISAAIGEGWKLPDLAPRLRSIRMPGSTFATVYLDEQPILELHDAAFATVERNGVHSVTVEQSYRILAGA